MTPVNSSQFVKNVIENYQRSSEMNSDVMPLDERIIQSFAQITAQTENTKNIALQQVENPKKGMTSEDFINLQEVVANYNIEVSLISTIARKSVGAVETLLRS